MGSQATTVQGKTKISCLLPDYPSPQRPPPFLALLLLLLLLLLTTTTSPASATLTVYNTTLGTAANFSSYLEPTQATGFPNHPISGYLYPVTMTTGCTFTGGDNVSLETTSLSLIALVNISDANAAGCPRVYQVAMALSKFPAFRGMVVNVGPTDTVRRSRSPLSFRIHPNTVAISLPLPSPLSLTLGRREIE